MTQQELTLLNLGENLDQLANLDPRGYGVCRILYKASRGRAGEPVVTRAAKQLHQALGAGELVYIITGFVLLPWGKAETDGIVSAVLLARALVKAYDAKPVLVVPEENLAAARGLAAAVGLHIYNSIEELRQYPVSMAALTFTKDKTRAAAQAEDMLAQATPKAVVSIEAPGANAQGVYHNATGLNTTHLEAKTDVLFEKLRERGVLNIAVGDLGNEIGMGAIGPHLERYIPYTAGQCRCGCGGGIAAASQTDNLITATVSDWGCYGLIAALAYLTRDLDVMHDAALEAEAMRTAAQNGMIDMYGWMIPAIDGFGLPLTTAIVTAMRECVAHALKLEKTCAAWFEKVLEKNFFEENKTWG